MKKSASILGVVFLIVLSCLCGAGCSNSGGGGSDSIVGKWVQEGYTGNDAYMEFRSDSTLYYVTVNNGSENPTKIGTYSTNGSNLTMNNEMTGQTLSVTYSVSNGKLTISTNGATEYYVRYGSGSGSGSGANNPNPLVPGLG